MVNKQENQFKHFPPIKQAEGLDLTVSPVKEEKRKPSDQEPATRPMKRTRRELLANFTEASNESLGSHNKSHNESFDPHITTPKNDKPESESSVCVRFEIFTNEHFKVIILSEMRRCAPSKVAGFINKNFKFNSLADDWLFMVEACEGTGSSGHAVLICVDGISC